MDLKRYDRENQKFCTMESSATLCAKGSKNSSKTGTHKDHNLLVSMQTNGIDMQQKSMKKTSEKDQTPETSEQLELMKSPITIYSQLDFLVRLSQLLGSGKDLKIYEALSFLISQGYSQPKNLDIYFLKMSPDSYRMIGAEHFKSYSQSLMNWGMTFNGRCLTAKISESHRIGKECSLSDILEEHVDRKYFLSEEATKNLLGNQSSKGSVIHSQYKMPADITEEEPM